jgi:hypothetical protein
MEMVAHSSMGQRPRYTRYDFTNRTLYKGKIREHIHTLTLTITYLREKRRQQALRSASHVCTLNYISLPDLIKQRKEVCCNRAVAFDHPFQPPDPGQTITTYHICRTSTKEKEKGKCCRYNI